MNAPYPNAKIMPHPSLTGEQIVKLQRDFGLVLRSEFNKTGIRFWFDSSAAQEPGAATPGADSTPCSVGTAASAAGPAFPDAA